MDPFTEQCEIAIERSIIERTQFDAHHVSIGHNRGVTLSRLLLRRKHATGNEPISVADRSSVHVQRARFCLVRVRSLAGDAPVPPLGGARPGQ